MNPHPDWPDHGRRVEIRREDGTLAFGELVIDDVSVDDHGEEYPHWEINLDDGSVVYLSDVEWRFISPPPIN